MTTSRRPDPLPGVLAVTTGLVEAVSVLGLGHRFTANMPGNSRAPVCWPGCLWAWSA
jgi:uncharacterized membrane protein YoaK (UPF0700 family)